MKYSVIIKANNSPELLERLLRICRHRGFSVQNINAETTENEQSLDVSLTVCSDRPISLLSKQLEKQFGVTQVATVEEKLAIKVSA